MRVALAQILASDDPAANLELVADHTALAAQQGASVVVFPEATMCRFGVSLKPVAEPLDGPWANEVREIAATNDVLVVAGMFTPTDDGRVTNTLLAVGRGVDTAYDKIHLYDAFGFAESDTVQPGSTPTVVDLDGETIGLATCYDIRFPELFRALADRGASTVLLPASWVRDGRRVPGRRPRPARGRRRHGVGREDPPGAARAGEPPDVVLDRPPNRAGDR